MSWLFYPSIFLAISQAILTNRVISRWEEYDQETIRVHRNNYYGEYYDNVSRYHIENGALSPLFWGISSAFLGGVTWITYILGYIMFMIIMGSYFCECNDNCFGGLFITQLYLWINSYTYSRYLIGYPLVLLTLLVVYTIKFTLIVPVYFIDDLLQGKLKSKSESKVKDYINKSFEVFNFIIKD